MKETPQEKTAKIIIKRNAAEKVGKKLTMRNGMEAEIICYRNSADIDVRFEDGFVTTHTTYKNFCRRSVHNPNYSGYEHRKKTLKKLHTGEKRQMPNGLWATIIEYRGYSDVDIEYSDGTLVEHCSYQPFKEGRIEGSMRTLQDRRIGMRHQMNSGEWCEIIAYRKAVDLDVRFDDGTVVKSCKWQHFQKGAIWNPNSQPDQIPAARKRDFNKKKYEGASFYAACGLVMTITKYRNTNDIDVIFENGYEKSHLQLVQIKKGVIRNPELPLGSLRGASQRAFRGFSDLRFAFRLSDGRVFYEAVSPDGGRGIWTPQQMMAFSPETDTEEPHQERSLHTPCK